MNDTNGEPVEHPLDAVRGIMCGFGLVLPFWIVVCAVIVWVLR